MNLMRTSFVKIVAAVLAGVGFVVAVTSAGAQCCMVDVWSDFVTGRSRETYRTCLALYLQRKVSYRRIARLNKSVRDVDTA
ncbi:MAG: hypothetical protein ACKOWP_00665, partial [Microbacteriaceae bacterium]